MKEQPPAGLLKRSIAKICSQLHPTPPSSFQLIPSSLQHPQRYKNQCIACNWAISPNLGQKNLKLSFFSEISTHSILEVVNLNPNLHFRNSDHKILWWANLGRKSQSCPFCLKIGTQGISGMFILVLTLVFLISNSKLIFR